jgi:hypothetical protein
MTVHSSHGILVIDASGVVDCGVSSYDGEELRGITRFDLDEWERYWKMPLPDCFDILDLGYWSANGAYEEPALDWRRDLARPTPKSTPSWEAYVS